MTEEKIIKSIELYKKGIIDPLCFSEKIIEIYPLTDSLRKVIIKKILPELDKELEEWGFDQEYNVGKFLDYLKDKYK